MQRIETSSATSGHDKAPYDLRTFERGKFADNLRRKNNKNGRLLDAPPISQLLKKDQKMKNAIERTSDMHSFARVDLDVTNTALTDLNKFGEVRVLSDDLLMITSGGEAAVCW